jgi:CRP/FNR family transcriptional regulator, anaerobic regulatory protein
MTLKHISISAHATHCSTCMMGNVCLPTGMPSAEIKQLDDLVKERIRIPKGRRLFSKGQNLDALYALRLGSLKTQLEDVMGVVQVTGFYLPGEIMGLDGMLEGVHDSNAIALEDSEVCVVRLIDIDQVGMYVPSLQQQIRRLMSKEIARSHQALVALGSMRSEQRLASFLLNLSQRLRALGYSSTDFVMRMSREEIGNYLGLTIETISRLFSRFARDGVIKVNQREVKILDLEAIKELAGQPCTPSNFN